MDFVPMSSGSGNSGDEMRWVETTNGGEVSCQRKEPGRLPEREETVEVVLGVPFGGAGEGWINGWIDRHWDEHQGTLVSVHDGGAERAADDHLRTPGPVATFRP